MEINFFALLHYALMLSAATVPFDGGHGVTSVVAVLQDVRFVIATNSTSLCVRSCVLCRRAILNKEGQFQPKLRLNFKNIHTIQRHYKTKAAVQCR